jgi:hypothetical protein
MMANVHDQKTKHNRGGGVLNQLHNQKWELQLEETMTNRV